MNANTAASNVPSAMPRRRWPRYLLATALLMVIFVPGGYWCVKWWSEGQTEAAMAEVTRLDPGWRLDDIEAAREVLKPEENSALQVIKVYGLARQAGNRTGRPEFYEQFEKLAPPHELNAVQVELLRHAYAEIQEARVEARKLKDMPKGRFAIKYSPDFISTMLSNQQNARRVMEVLQHDVYLRAQAGDLDGALESCRAGLNTARSLGDEPLLITVLIRIAGDHIAVQALERTLAQGRQPGEPALRELQALLEQEIVDVEKHWINSLRGERAGHERVIRAINEGKLKGSGLFWGFGAPASPNAMAWLVDLAPAIITREYPALLRHMNQCVEMSKLPLEQQRDRWRELEATIPKNSVLVRLLLPALDKVGMAHLRNQAMLRGALIAVAAERYRLKYERWPEAVADLVQTEFLKKAPADPFDGAAMRWRRWDEGMVAYSVGLDKADNGGHVDIARFLDPGVDVGVKLWDPDRRRQPPRPPVVKDDGLPPGR